MNTSTNRKAGKFSSKAMVTPAPAKASRRKRSRRNYNPSEILLVIVVGTASLGAAWFLVSWLSVRDTTSSDMDFSSSALMRMRHHSDTDTDTDTDSGGRSSNRSSNKVAKHKRTVGLGGFKDTASVPADASATATTAHLSAKAILAAHHPYLLYGTAWKENRTADLVSRALHHGFRFIDTACQPKHYSEPGVGEGWTKAATELGLSRDDVFLQTKFTSLNGQDPDDVPYDAKAPLEEQVKQSVAASLKNLKTTYIDSLVLHSPMPALAQTMVVWRTFETFVDDGSVRQLGISNCYDIDKLKNLYEAARIKPSVIQNRFVEDHDFDVAIREFCAENDMRYQSFWTLTGNRKVLASSGWKRVAKERGVTPQTLMYAYMMTKGHLPLSGTKDEKHMEEDVGIMKRVQSGDFVLEKEELKVLSKFLGVQE